VTPLFNTVPHFIFQDIIISTRDNFLGNMLKKFPKSPGLWGMLYLSLNQNLFNQQHFSNGAVGASLYPIEIKT
jgi:hypothetical protein